MHDSRYWQEETALSNDGTNFHKADASVIDNTVSDWEASYLYIALKISRVKKAVVYPNILETLILAIAQNVTTCS